MRSLSADLEAKSLRQKRRLNVLVIGDSHVGKTTFLQNYCNIQLKGGVGKGVTGEKIELGKKTIGCDVHVSSHSPNVRSLLSDSPSIDRSVVASLTSEEFQVQFWDLAGEAKQREFLHVFTRHKIHKLDAILFFFDATNLNTFLNLYKWLITVFHNTAHKKDYACVWQIPFLLIGTKIDQVPAQYGASIKSKLLSKLSRMFLCTKGENLLFLDATKIDSASQRVEMMMFNLFISEICIEKAMRFSSSLAESQSCSSTSLNSIGGGGGSYSQLSGFGQSEYTPQDQLPFLNKSMTKYRLNSDNYKNKRAIEEGKNFLQIMMEVSQVAEYKKVWLNQVATFASRLKIIKDKLFYIFSVSASKSPSEQGFNLAAEGGGEEEEVSLSNNI